MTLEDLKVKCTNYGLKYAYGVFKEPVDPPFLVVITRDTDNFMADNKVYSKDIPVQLEYIFKEKDLTMESLIEDTILGDIPWNKTEETYLEDEQVFEVSYFFELDTKREQVSL